MSDQIYFSGDPSTDSARRHLERVLSGEQRQRWGWVAAAMAGATAWSLWRVRRARRNGVQPTTPAAPAPAADRDPSGV
jgi:hypothetical protein